MIAAVVIPGMGIATERRRRPEAVGTPVALIGMDGMVTVCSREAEQAGVRPGQRPAAARSICRDMLLFPYDDGAYRVAAEPVWNYCAEESSIVEPISAEEVCLVLSLSDWRLRSQVLAKRLADLTGCPVSVGVARSKFVARMAATTVEPGQLHAIAAGFEREFLAPLPIGKADGLDSDTLTRLTRLGILTFGDMAALGNARLPKALQTSGMRLSRLAEGHDANPVRPLWPPPKARARVAFEESTDDQVRITAALAVAATELAETLVARQTWCKKLCLTIETETQTLQETENLRLPLRDAPTLARAAERCLARLDLPAAVRRQLFLPAVLGVVVEAGNLGSAGATQLMLFDPASHDGRLPHEQEAALSACLSRIARRFGAAPHYADHLHVPRACDLSVDRLTRRLVEGVAVDVTKDGLPQRVVRSGKSYRVAEIADRWREAHWFRELSECAVYRVVTDRGFLELMGTEGSWWVRGQAD